jgi:hypothetical protein
MGCGIADDGTVTKMFYQGSLKKYLFFHIRLITSFLPNIISAFELKDSMVSHFPVRTYNGLKDLFDTIMKPANHSSSRVIIWTKYNTEFTQPEPVYVYTNIIKPDLVGDTYARLLTPLHFPSSTGYHRFDYPMYKPLEKKFFETISIRIVTKNGSDVVFDDSVITCLVVLHFKKRSSMK